MANKRMFSVNVTETDAFYNLSAKAQALYFHLGMHADDDGFVSSPVRSCGASKPVLNQLEAAGYIIRFNSGVVVVTDWKINNFLRKDRHSKTIFQSELAQLEETSTGRYFLKDCGQPDVNQKSTNGMPDRNQRSTQYSIEENSIEKSRKDKPNIAADAAGDGFAERDKVDIFSNFANGDDELLTALREFNQMRNRMKKPMTDRAKQMLCNKLNEKFQPCEWVAILEQSVYRNWSDIYPLGDNRSVASTSDEDSKTQLDRILNDLKSKNRGVEQ